MSLTLNEACVGSMTWLEAVDVGLRTCIGSHGCIAAQLECSSPPDHPAGTALYPSLHLVHHGFTVAQVNKPRVATIKIQTTS